MSQVSGRSLTFLMSSRQLISGESPPCTHRNCWLSRAARGRQSKASIQASYTRSEYLILPAVKIKIGIQSEVIITAKDGKKSVEFAHYSKGLVDVL